ncbi:hypothetical protein PPERSA_12539 [Pseudocohnilembus persalinus]|uniref:Uncharacterized protein n=1 Tax=Pseudocohnilembus persalinus TaxID=266149 RepID=A0A0V0QBA6_PSEPJ|nr:hypothetical protein PPERSA_12539 [Pseudocohnilembus persalinus]|eukprot:KRW99435.1 hypothetical protein PPERSA_12539 [Pseudocohnilembus persalinus]
MVEQNSLTKSTYENIKKAIKTGMFLVFLNPDETFIEIIQTLLKKKVEQFLANKFEFSDNQVEKKQDYQQNYKQVLIGNELVQMNANFKIIIIFDNKCQNKQNNLKNNLLQNFGSSVLEVDLNCQNSNEIYGNIVNDIFMGHFYWKEKQFYHDNYMSKIQNFRQNRIFIGQLQKLTQELVKYDESISLLENQNNFQQTLNQIHQIMAAEQQINEQIQNLQDQYEKEEDEQKLKLLYYNIKLEKTRLNANNYVSWYNNQDNDPKNYLFQVKKNYKIENLGKYQQNYEKIFNLYQFSELISLQFQFVQIVEFVIIVSIKSNEQIQEEEEYEEQNEESKTNLYSVQEEDSQESIQKMISPINKYSIQQSVERFDKKISSNKKSVRLTSLENICDIETENQNKKQTSQSYVSENYIEQQQQDQQQLQFMLNNINSQNVINKDKDMLELNEYLVKYITCFSLYLNYLPLQILQEKYGNIRKSL